MKHMEKLKALKSTADETQNQRELYQQYVEKMVRVFGWTDKDVKEHKDYVQAIMGKDFDPASLYQADLFQSQEECRKSMIDYWAASLARVFK